MADVPAMFKVFKPHYQLKLLTIDYIASYDLFYYYLLFLRLTVIFMGFFKGVMRVL